MTVDVVDAGTGGVDAGADPAAPPAEAAGKGPKQGKKGPKVRTGRETVFGEMYDPVADTDPLPRKPKKSEEQMESLLEKVKSSAFLKAIDEKRKVAVLGYMELKEVKAGDMVFKQGEQGDHFYIVDKGTFKCFEKEEDEDEGLGEEKATYDESNPCFGEVALLYRDARPNSVKAETDGALWQIDRKLYTRVVVKMAYRKRQRHMKFMNQCPILESVLNHEKVRLCDALEEKTYKADEVIIKEGEEPDGIYFVEKGEVIVKKKSGDGEAETIVKKGGHFGELALLSYNKRDATCTAKTDCEVVFLDVDAFERLMGRLKCMMLRDREKYKKFCLENFDEEDPDEDIIR